MVHVSQDDLEVYCVGLETGAAIEEHMPICAACLDRAEACAEFIDGLRKTMRGMEENPAVGVMSRLSPSVISVIQLSSRLISCTSKLTVFS